MEPIEHIDPATGDLWIVRACDDDDGCTVVERFLTKTPASVGGAASLALHWLGRESRGEDQPADDEPVESIHVPAGSLAAVADGLRAALNESRGL